MNDLVEAQERTESTPKKEVWEDRFFALVAETGNVTRACKGARVGRTLVYEHRRTRPEFARRWKEAEAMGVAALEDEARRRAFKGSDTLVIFLLKSHCPEVYREIVRNELLTPPGEALRGQFVIEYVNDWRDNSASE